MKVILVEPGAENFCPFCGVDLNTVDCVIFAGFTVCKPCWNKHATIHKEPIKGEQ